MNLERSFRCFPLVVALVVALSGLGGSAPGFAQTSAGSIFVTPQQASLALDGGAILLDARSAAEHAAAHPLGSVNSPWQDFSDPESLGRLLPDIDELTQRIRALGIDNATPVYVVGGWDEAWGEEGRIFWMLDVLGHPEVHIVTGGYEAWVSAGLPVAAGFGVAPRSGDFEATSPDTGLATIDELDATVILDVRTREEFDGATPYGAERGGHIPGAAHIHWHDVFDPDGNLLNAAELRTLLRADMPGVTAYCTGGVRSGFIYAILRELGAEAPRNYAGSWWEYAASDLPTE